MAKSQSVIARSELEGKLMRGPRNCNALMRNCERRTASTNGPKIQTQLAWIVESTDDAVLNRTPEGIITSWNAEEQLLLTNTRLTISPTARLL